MKKAFNTKPFLPLVVTIFVLTNIFFAADQQPVPSKLADEVKVADRQFCDDTRKEKLEGWVKWFSKDSTLGGLKSPVKGEAALREHYKGLFGSNYIDVEWDPTKAEVFPGGDLAYTVGRYKWHFRNEDNKDTFESGTYLTVWRKEKDGNWRVISDFGSKDPQ